jgi:alanine dehydrogenase
MIIGVPKEIKEQEYRVALLPSDAYQLIKRGHTQALTNVTYCYLETLTDFGGE